MRFPVIHLHVQSAYHNTATFTGTSKNLSIVLMPFLHMQTYFPPNCTVDFKMVARQGEKLQSADKVVKIPKNPALKVSRLQASEFSARLSEFDRCLEIASILYEQESPDF